MNIPVIPRWSELLVNLKMSTADLGSKADPNYSWNLFTLHILTLLYVVTDYIEHQAHYK